MDHDAPARPPIVNHFALEDGPARPPSRRERWTGPPRWLFHVAAGVAAVGALWVASAPVDVDAAGDPIAWAVAAVAAVWIVRLVSSALTGRISWRFAVVPAMAVLAAALITLDVPRDARWMAAESGFEDALLALPSAEDWPDDPADLDVPAQIGTYDVAGVTRDDADAVRFTIGDSSSRGGVTYLVDGVTDEVRDAEPGTTFEHLHGRWHVWRAG